MGQGGSEAPAPVLDIASAALTLGGRTLWSGLDLQIRDGEFVAVLGANGSGKTSLVRAVLGLQRLDSGAIRFRGRAVSRGDRRIGYVPQQRPLPKGTPLRGRDLVRFGIDGHRWGVGGPRAAARERVREVLAEVGAERYADAPVGDLSGGEQQRLRVGQALAGDPELLLCDEPLSSLDLQYQRAVCELVDRRRRTHGTPVLLVTHDINPVLGMVTRVLYLAGGRFRVGTPDEVLRTEVLTELYGTPVDVIRTRGRILVAGADATPPHHHDHHGHHGSPDPADQQGVAS